jgi:5-methylcytosine-specific restriction endonuclease McrA
LRVPRRRQRIFDASQGKCHYCGTALTLDGKWHIEHKMPKALMGTDEPTNLVASCVPCNTKKRDRTDIEFKQQIGQ